MHGAGAPVGGADALDRGGTTDLATEGAQTPSQCLGELTGPTLGDREPDGLSHHAHHQCHQARASGVEGDVGVARVAGEHDPRCLAPEAVAAEVGSGGEQRPDELEATGTTQVQQAGEPGANRREGGEQPRDEVLAHHVPVTAQVEPRLAVSRLLVLEPRGSELAVAVEQRPLPVGQRMAEYGGGVAPDEAVVLEVERPDRRGCSSQRVERAEGVVHELGMHVVVTAYGATEVGLGLEDEHGPAGVDEVVGGHQAVGPGADDDGVVRRHRSAASRCSVTLVARRCRPAGAASRRCATSDPVPGPAEGPACPVPRPRPPRSRRGSRRRTR